MSMISLFFINKNSRKLSMAVFCFCNYIMRSLFGFYGVWVILRLRCVVVALFVSVEADKSPFIAPDQWWVQNFNLCLSVFNVAIAQSRYTIDVT